MKKATEQISPPIDHFAKAQSTPSGPPIAIILCTLAFCLTALVNLVPLARLTGADYFRALPISTLLLTIGSWLPLDFYLTTDTRISQMSTHLILFLSLTALMFVLYALCAWCIHRQPTRRYVLRWVWLGALVPGLALIFAPAMLSHDAFVYAGYGRLLTVHHANPYFVTLSTFPNDPFVRLDDWYNAPAAYGPFWLLVSALGALLGGDHPLAYILFYRSLALAAHFLNILLVTAILRKQLYSERTVVLGTLLYAWNPLALLESALGAHMDTFMVTLILVGLLFWVRAERRDPNAIPRLPAYLPSLIAFTLATLIKFTAVPLVALSLLLLARKTLRPLNASSSPAQPLQWRATLSALFAGGLISAALALGLYAPFWIGHSIRDILASFTSPPSANSAYGSILSSLLNWIKLHGLPSPDNWLYAPLSFFSLYKTWQIINLITLLTLMACSAVWIWRTPTARTLALATLAPLTALLIVTPWFFPWYVIWIVGIAPACLPVAHDRLARALVGAVLAFSASAFFIYLFRGLSPIGDWGGLTFLTTVGPPILTLLALLLLPLPRKGYDNN